MTFTGHHHDKLCGRNPFKIGGMLISQETMENRSKGFIKLKLKQIYPQTV